MDRYRLTIREGGVNCGDGLGQLLRARRRKVTDRDVNTGQSMASETLRSVRALVQIDQDAHTLNRQPGQGGLAVWIGASQNQSRQQPVPAIHPQAHA